MKVEELIKDIGHDGSGVVFPTAPEPHRRRSFHIQEIIKVLWQRGYFVTPFEMEPQMGCRYDSTIINIPNWIPWPRPGVICGVIDNHPTLNGCFHAVAWDGNDYLDTLITKSNQLKPEVFYTIGAI